MDPLTWTFIASVLVGAMTGVAHVLRSRAGDRPRDDEAEDRTPRSGTPPGGTPDGREPRKW